MTTNTELTAETLADHLQLAIEDIEYADADDLPGEIAELAELLKGSRVESYRDGGYLTNNAGMAITFPGGRRFQITVMEG